MSYKFSKGFTVQGDIKAEDDTERNTLIDFGEDKIDLQTSGTVRITIDNDGVYIPQHISNTTVLKVSGNVEIGNGSDLCFQKGADDIAFIKFREGTDGTSYNGYLGYSAAEDIYISPGRGADFFVQSRTNPGGDHGGDQTFPFIIMDDGTVKFTKGLTDTAVRSADLSSDVAFYVSGTTDGQNNAVFQGNVVMSGAVTAEDNLIVDGRIGIGVDSPSYKLEIGGNMSVGQYIYHRNDTDTFINFTDNRIRLKAGDVGMIGCHKKSSAPHQVTINNGNNNVDFHINSNNNTNDPILMSDADTARIGIGTDAPDEKLTINTPNDSDQVFIQFQEAGADRAKIGINDSNNLVFHQQFTNKHIVFKVNDQGVTREGLRIDGAVPEVVVNEGSSSLVDFRVESSDSTHMLFVDGGNNKVGIGTSVPETTLHIHSDTINNGAVTISQADNSGDASQLDLSKARGTGQSPAAVQNNDFLGQVRFVAYDGNSYDNFSDIFVQAAGTISTTSHPTKMVFRTTRLNATSPVTAITIDENQNLIAEGNLEAFDTITIRNQNAPASATSNGFRGEIRYDSNYIYVCVADNTWKRVLLSTW
ncbi:MAG: hypothetical protein GOVbin703_98 [Prokaryotic dsDNA virus sp.]|nr:MAG: hypothetical protein GOVbin703_98 [Prokaryotic dsDNA virus sp.]|tara:strand:+ start:393 stop:2156 length:1764 start_codon:yes stop_codon:yes gene_type:complete